MYKWCEFIGKKSKATFHIAERDGGWNWRTAGSRFHHAKSINTQCILYNTFLRVYEIAQENEQDNMVSCRIMSKIQEGEQTAFLDPVLFLVMVNDLAYGSSYWKYVDDTIISEVNPHAWSTINYTR